MLTKGGRTWTRMKKNRKKKEEIVNFEANPYVNANAARETFESF